ncbi:N-acetylglucosamine-6-phosphate deacetylase [Paucibacter soli]|uniref:N-acetylglucosamine-6-phosphate deacetylase n=1 Tax=Paucibacter soli TaxID=3133433 RepID=UPI0030B2900B
MMKKLHGQILTPQGWLPGRLSFDERLRAIEEERSAPQRYILPGFIDLHVHGGGGVDVMQGGDAALKLARLHARHGTTALLATTMTAHLPQIERALTGVAAAMAAQDQADTQAARILGVHLEGPFLNHRRLGAQPPLVLEATLEGVQRLHALAPIKVLTLATEVGQHLALIPQLVALGLRVQIGHSAGSYEDGVAALGAGASGFTHLFNGMTGLNHYQPGMVGAALAHAEFAELIPDLEHVHPGALRAALRAIPRAYGITDATAATGMPDGEYELGPQRVMKCMGCVRLLDGSSLAGSALTMDQALRNLVAIGLPLAEASQRLSQYPAEFLGLAERGRLAPGAWADVLVLDEQLRLLEVYVQGQAIPLS